MLAELACLQLTIKYMRTSICGPPARAPSKTGCPGRGGGPGLGTPGGDRPGTRRGNPRAGDPPPHAPGPWQRARAHEEPRQLGNVLNQNRAIPQLPRCFFQYTYIYIFFFLSLHSSRCKDFYPGSCESTPSMV